MDVYGEFGKQYKSRSGLCNHEQGHSKQAPYKCCSKLFYSRANLLRHRWSAHGEAKTCCCKYCEHSFATIADLSRHEKLHTLTAFKCNECGIEINHRQRYQDHVAAHKGERNHVCECGKTYIYKSNLYRHRKTCSTRQN